MTSLRCKAECGVMFSWRIGQRKDGKWKPKSVGSPSNRMPMDFAPFEIMDAVLNKHIAFDTEQQALDYVRSL